MPDSALQQLRWLCWQEPSAVLSVLCNTRHVWLAMRCGAVLVVGCAYDRTRGNTVPVILHDPWQCLCLVGCAPWPERFLFAFWG